MISNRRITAVSRLLITALFVLWMLVPRAQAQTAAADITGVYSGSYDGPNGTVRFKLSLTAGERGNLTGAFTSSPTDNTVAAVETTDLIGFYRGANHRFQLRIKNARTVPPSKGAMLGINGTFDPAGGQISGMMVILGSVPAKFEAARGGAESAKMGSATTETPKTTPPVPQSTAAAQTVATIDGVYNGTYICGQGTTDLKLSLQGSASGDISALFTFYLPPGTQQHGYTYSLRGRYNPQTSKFSLTPVQWETGHPDNFGMVGMNGTASASGLDGNITGGACRTFHVERNEGESANIAAVIAAQKSVGPPVSAPSPEEERYTAALRAQAPASARGAYPAPSPSPPPQVAQSQPLAGVTPSAVPQDAIQQAASQPANAMPAPAAANPTSSISCFFCMTVDSNQPAVYFSDIFDVPYTGGAAAKFIQYMHVKIGFWKYLIDTYGYVRSSEDSIPIQCFHAEVGPDMPKAVAAEVAAAKKRSLEIDAVTAKKQIVDTGWKYTGTSETVASTSTPASPPVAPQPAAPSAPVPASDEPSSDNTEAAANSPLLVWHMESKKDPLTDVVTTQPTATKFFLDGGEMVTVTANCGNNGVSVFFLATAGSKDPAPQFGWYTDNSDDSGDQVADVRMRVDGGDVHVAQGYPNKEGHTEYTNWLGLLFYSPGLVRRVAQDQENNANTGILALDSLLAPMVRDAAKANARGWAANSAGPLSNLVNAKSIRIELPLANQSSARIVELNPQDRVLHKFVSDCYAGFTSQSQPAPAASPGTRQRYSK